MTTPAKPASDERVEECRRRLGQEPEYLSWPRRDVFALIARIDALKAEVAEVTRERDGLRLERRTGTDVHNAQLRQNIELQAERDRMRAALEFYADPSTYEQVDVLGSCGLSTDTALSDSSLYGHRARQALAGGQGGERDYENGSERPGLEAEELRSAIEHIIETASVVDVDDASDIIDGLQRLLDAVDARDSLKVALRIKEQQAELDRLRGEVREKDAESAKHHEAYKNVIAGLYQQGDQLVRERDDLQRRLTEATKYANSCPTPGEVTPKFLQWLGDLKAVLIIAAPTNSEEAEESTPKAGARARSTEAAKSDVETSSAAPFTRDSESTSGAISPAPAKAESAETCGSNGCERPGWMETAAQHLRNERFYCGLLDETAKHLGPEVFVANDGSVMDEPLRLKVPEMVGAIRTALDEALGLLETAKRWLQTHGDGCNTINAFLHRHGRGGK